MAVTVLGGVAVSTLLTLFVVPAAYIVFEWAGEAIPMFLGWLFTGLFRGRPFPDIPSIAHAGERGKRASASAELDKADSAG